MAMFWLGMGIFCVIAIAPVVTASIMNRVTGDSLDDSDDIRAAADGASE